MRYEILNYLLSRDSVETGAAAERMSVRARSNSAGNRGWIKEDAGDRQGGVVVCRVQQENHGDFT